MNEQIEKVVLQILVDTYGSVDTMVFCESITSDTQADENKSYLPLICFWLDKSNRLIFTLNEKAINRPLEFALNQCSSIVSDEEFWMLRNALFFKIKPAFEVAARSVAERLIKDGVHPRDFFNGLVLPAANSKGNF